MLVFVKAMGTNLYGNLQIAWKGIEKYFTFNDMNQKHSLENS